MSALWGGYREFVADYGELMDGDHWLRDIQTGYGVYEPIEDDYPPDTVSCQPEPEEETR